MRWKINRTWRIVLIVLVVLVGFRLSLPYFVTRYVNKVLSDIPGYRGVIDEVNIHLIRGAYQIHGLKLYKVDGHKEIPFVDIPVTDLSVEWKALFEGAVVGEVKFDRPVLNFIAGKKTGKGEDPSEQSGKEVDWTEPIKRLMPLQINRLTISDGKVTFHDFTTKPRVDLFLSNVNLDAQNLNNAKDNPEELPSKIFLQATSIGNGQLSMTMKINVLKQVPDLDMDLKFESVNMKALNDFFEAYAKVDVEQGDFNLYSELAVLDGKINGYVKPLFNDLKVADWKKDKDQPIKLVWESVVGFLTEIFENQQKNQFATRVPMEGEISSVETAFWPALWNIFRNAFIEAFESNTDGSINIASADDNASGKENDNGSKAVEEKKDKKELRKEKRKERREKRKERKKEKGDTDKADKEEEDKVKG